MDLYWVSTRPCWNINLSKGLWYASKRAIIIVIWLSSRRANWWLEFYWCRRVKCVKVVIMIIMSNDPVWLMCCHWWHICYRSLLAILRKKVGKPKEEIRNLYGFHMNSFNWRIHMYKLIYMNSFTLWIHLIRIYFLHCPLRLFPWAQHTAAGHMSRLQMPSKEELHSLQQNLPLTTRLRASGGDVCHALNADSRKKGKGHHQNNLR